MFLPQLKSISDLRQDTLGLLTSVSQSTEPTVITHRSQPLVVLVSVEKYEQLIEALEILEDQKDALQFMSENKSKIDWRSHDKVFQSKKSS